MPASPFLLSKARPTPDQLQDRLRAPRPDGLELYLDVADVRDEAAMAASRAAVEAASLGSDVPLLIEGPVGSLDGAFFDPTRDAEADRELVRRLARLARELGARAVNVHLISPSEDLGRLRSAERLCLLERSVPFLAEFAERVSAAGATPTIENMPPVLRMRRNGIYYSPIGMPAEDLAWVAARVPGLALTLDLSHAGLYVNARRAVDASGEVGQELASHPALRAFLGTLPTVDDVEAYAAALGRAPLTCHVANAAGLMGEGEAYDAGELDLDALVRHLASSVRYFVTETLEAASDRAVNMRAAISGMRRALGRAEPGPVPAPERGGA